MTQIILYMLKSLLCGALFWVLYKTIAERYSSYSFQRVYLLLASLFTTVFPLISIPLFSETIPELRIPAVIIRADKGVGIENPVTDVNITNPGELFEKIFFALAIIYALYLIFQITILAAIYLCGDRRRVDGVSVVFNNNVKSPFSFMRTIFLNKSVATDSMDADMLICHEKAHISRNHTGDLLLISILKIFQWFNPFTFLFGKALASVHEFQADWDVIAKGYDVDKYQRFILSIQFGISPILANRLNNSLTIKRLRKMSILIKKKTSMAGVALLSLSALALFIGISCVTLEEVKAAVPDKLVAGVFDQQDNKASVTQAATPTVTKLKSSTVQNKPVKKTIKTTTTTTSVKKEVVVEVEDIPANVKSRTQMGKNENEEEIPFTMVKKEYGPDDEFPFQIVENKPKFQGGDENAFTKWVFEKLIYPADAVKNKVQGRVILQFVVDEEGNVGDVKVMRGVSQSLDEEAIRVVAMSPKWTPGSQKGKNVNVRYVFPVIFQLR